MRLRNIRGAKKAIAASPYVVQDAQQYRGRWNEFFGNCHPLHIEIGMGKGQFITSLAQKNPGINYIGIELYESVLIRAVTKREAIGECPNLIFLRYGAEHLEGVFAPGEVERIYLNFSDPWPKERHAKRHHSPYMEGNIMTEYEERFSALGNPIHRLVAFPPKDSQVPVS